MFAIIAVAGAMGGNNKSTVTPAAPAAATVAPAALSQETRPSSVMAPSTTTSAPATSSALSPASAPAPVIYTVVNVVDGDTIDVTGSDSSAFRVRIIGIDDYLCTRRSGLPVTTCQRMKMAR